jgi:hypothetical protein
MTFAPGKSPFRINGVFYIGARQYIQDRIPGGMAKIAELLADPALVAFCNQPFLATAFYDLLPIAPLTHACAHAKGITFAQYVDKRATAQASSDIAGVYKGLMARRGAVVPFLEGVARLSARIYEFGAMEVKALGEHAAELRRVEIPEPVLSWYLASTQSYVAELLHAAGVAGVKTQWAEKEKLPAKSGIDLYAARLMISWT